MARKSLRGRHSRADQARNVATYGISVEKGTKGLVQSLRAPDCADVRPRDTMSNFLVRRVVLVFLFALVAATAIIHPAYAAGNDGTPDGRTELSTGPAEGFWFGLPVEVETNGGRSMPDGTINYDSVIGGSSLVVRADSDGATQIETILPNASAPRTYTYSLPSDYSAFLRPDGGVVAFSANSQQMQFRIERVKGVTCSTHRVRYSD